MEKVLCGGKDTDRSEEDEGEDLEEDGEKTEGPSYDGTPLRGSKEMRGPTVRDVHSCTLCCDQLIYPPGGLSCLDCKAWLPLAG